MIKKFKRVADISSRGSRREGHLPARIVQLNRDFHRRWFFIVASARGVSRVHVYTRYKLVSRNMGDAVIYIHRTVSHCAMTKTIPYRVTSASQTHKVMWLWCQQVHKCSQVQQRVCIRYVYFMLCTPGISFVIHICHHIDIRFEVYLYLLDVGVFSQFSRRATAESCTYVQALAKTSLK